MRSCLPAWSRSLASVARSRSPTDWGTHAAWLSRGERGFAELGGLLVGPGDVAAAGDAVVETGGVPGAGRRALPSWQGNTYWSCGHSSRRPSRRGSWQDRRRSFVDAAGLPPGPGRRRPRRVRPCCAGQRRVGARGTVRPGHRRCPGLRLAALARLPAGRVTRPSSQLRAQIYLGCTFDGPQMAAAATPASRVRPWTQVYPRAERTQAGTIASVRLCGPGPLGGLTP